MKLRTTFILLFLLLFSLASVNLVLGIFLERTERVVEISRNEMHQLNDIAEEVVISSQWQTRFARTYITNKDPKRFDWYYKISDILEGKIARPDNYSLEYWDLVTGGLVKPPEEKIENGQPIEDRFLKHNITPQELNKLREARIHLSKLSMSEQIAMHAIVGEFDDGTGAFARKGKPDQALANKLLFSDEYNKGNADISLLISQLKNMINARYGEMIHRQQTLANELLRFNSFLSMGLFALIVLSVIYLRQRFGIRGRKLMHFVRSISKDGLTERTNISGYDEIGELASAIDGMSENLNLAFDQLEDKIRLSDQALAELGEERIRSEKLLHNILPATIATRLQGGEETIAEVFPEVTVSFSDIVGFTDLSARLGPHGTVNMLSALFGAFDELAEKHQVEKIKTIGDCYMVVGGVPNRDPLHCQHIAEFALDALKAVEEISAHLPFPIQMRMGIHTGTVAAGVVGKKKFSYDLWGDVVNVASRFETTASPDKIHVSEAVRVRLSDDFLFHDSGIVELKGKGKVPSFYLLGKKKENPSIIEFR
ncbi:MAG: adenylate/guanylate cyclase domain-containing protein [Methylocystaceae bacterium]|nr:adenylate/guanylate cyclase domain-containing protein [Methylocystaceae bacterium]